jgi:hypothetical protein
LPARPPKFPWLHAGTDMATSTNTTRIVLINSSLSRYD